MKIQNKLYNKEVERRLNKLNADFINLDGEFKQFTIDNKLDIEERNTINDSTNFAISR